MRHSQHQLCSQARSRSIRERGFTLLEVLVAFSILSLSLGALIQIFGTGLRNTALAEEYSVAVMHAESLLAELGVQEPLTAGSLGGELDDRFRWQANIEEYIDEDSEALALESQLPAIAYQVELSVSWGDGDGASLRRVSLQTLRLVSDQELLR